MPTGYGFSSMSLELEKDPAGQRPNGSELTTDELIRVGIDGKAAAVARYDVIIWKIRAGYVVVIYGAITAISALSTKSRPVLKHGWLLPLIVATFSLAAFVIDHTFSRSKFRVVVSRNELVDAAWQILLAASPRSELEQRRVRLRKLSEMSGERDDPATSDTVKAFLRSREMSLIFLSLYVVPVVASAVVVIFGDL
jgi:hypothetical protein